jgi:hypothetical protein
LIGNVFIHKETDDDELTVTTKTSSFGSEDELDAVCMSNKVWRLTRMKSVTTLHPHSLTDVTLVRFDISRSI